VNPYLKQYVGPQKLRGDIKFENVVFGYTAERPILKGIDFHIPAGRKVALVGLSGGGKTTLVKLIPRFYEATQGSVKVDGVDNRQYPLHILRQNISMVLQDSVLFEGTVRENIVIGRPGASEEEIIDAAKKADIHHTIVNALGGYDRQICEQGNDLSGSQRQRMAIARAILRDAPILVLDEPTASLDVEAEAEVLHALDMLVVGRTVLMISHRLSTLGNVDEIIVLKDGCIVEQGNYQELKRLDGIFAHLLKEQTCYNVDSVRHAGDRSILASAFSHQQYSLPLAVSNVQPVLGGMRYPQGAMPPQGGGYGNGQPLPPRGGYGNGQSVPPPPPVPPAAKGPSPSKVIVELDGKVISERRLDKPVLTVGRLSGNDIQVPNQRVSRLHAKIRSEDGAWVIEDAESVNGILYNGKRIEKLVLSSGDVIHIAPGAVLRFQG
jgi:ABC-type multidrug transport system ATPase subunit